MATIKEVIVPDIGNFKDVEVIEVAVKKGDVVKVEDTLITLETEKASMDVPSPVNGVIQDLKVKLGDKVSQGHLIVLIEVMEAETIIPIAEQTQSEAAASAVASSMPPNLSAISEVIVPDIGNFASVEIIEVAVKKGDTVKVEDTLITLETEKASMDVPSPVNGVIQELKVKLGDKVSQGHLIALIEVVGVAVAPTARAPLPDKPEAPVTRSAAPATDDASIHRASSLAHAGPATRRLARELGVDLTTVIGSGLKNRITTKDVQAYVKSILQGGGIAQGNGINIEKMPDIDFSQFGEIEIKPLNRIKKWTGKNLHRNWVTIPHITQFDEADITELEAFRQDNRQAAEANGIKLTPLAFILKAVISALKHYPQFNASLTANGTELVLKKYFHIGVAVDTPQGLMVPVLRHVDNKGVFDLAKELAELGALAKQGKLKAEQMQGSCFTISSLGGVGGTAFTPIINAPDVAILGISKAQIKPIYIDNQFVPRKILPLSLSYDHRVIDGVEGAKFTAHIAEQLQDIRKLLL